MGIKSIFEIFGSAEQSVSIWMIYFQANVLLKDVPLNDLHSADLMHGSFNSYRGNQRNWKIPKQAT